MSITNYSRWPGAISAIAMDLDNAPDEHGAWQTGIVSDRKRRGVAINVELIDYTTTPSPLAVVQVRQCRFRPGWHNRVRKNYFLIGRNENSRPFAHSVPCGVARSSGVSQVIKAQAWIWGVTPTGLRSVLRQGDVALVPARGKQRGTLLSAHHTAHFRFHDSHLLSASEIRIHGQTWYALNPRLTHNKNQHPTIEAVGWYEVRVGKRAPVWAFSLNTAD